MKHYFITFVALAIFTHHHSYALDIYRLVDSDPQADPNAKLCQLTQAQLDQILTPTPSNVVDAAAASASSKYVLISDGVGANFATNVAQLLSSSGFQVCSVEAALQSQLPGEVTIIQPGARKIVYYGKRNADTLYRFVQKLDVRYSTARPFQTISNKMEKKAFEHLIVPKVVAYFPDTTAPAFLEFQQAARQMTPNPQFFVVHDPQYAKKFKLAQPGQIALIHRLEKSTLYFQPQTVASTNGQATLAPATPATAATVTAADIVTWISQNRGLIIHELDDTNLYDPEVLDPSKYLLAAIADQTSPLGLYFHKILTKTIQNISRENEIRANLALNPTQLPDPNAVQQPLPIVKLDDIEVIWIDLQRYPLAAQKLLQTGNLAQGPAQEVYFGLVQIPAGVLTNAQANQWLSMAQLHPLTEKKSEEANIQLLRNWILTVTDRLPIQAGPNGAGPNVAPAEPKIEVLQQTFTLEPEPVNVRAGGSFVLDCKVQYKAGKCQWVKDNKLVPVGVTGAYQWVNEHDIEDCSISVSGADAARDNGKWTCQLTDASMPDGTVVVAAISSQPVTVNVRLAKAKGQAKAPAKGEL